VAADNTAEQSLAAMRLGIPDLSAGVNQWLAESSKALTQKPSLDALSDLQASGRKLEENLNTQNAALNERAKTIEDEATQVNADETLWAATSKAAQAAGAPQETLALCESVAEAIKAANTRLKHSRTGILELQSQFSALAGKLNAGIATVRQANAAALETLFVRDSAPLWATQTPPSQAGPSGQSADSPSRQAADAVAYARRHPDLLLVHLAIFGVLLVILLWLKRGLRKWAAEEPDLERAAPILDVPIATALALSFVVKGTMYADAPASFRAALGIVLLLPIIVLLRRLLDHRLHPALYFLLLFYFVGEVRATFAAMQTLNRWIYSGELLAVLIVFWWVTTTSGDQTEAGAGAVLGRFARNLCRLAILLLIGALTAGVLGYDRLSTMVGTAVLHSTYAAVFLFALVRVLLGLLLIALRVRPLRNTHIASQHHIEVHRRIHRVLAVVALLVWAWMTLGFFQLQTLAMGWGATVLDFKLPAGGSTMGQLIGFAAAIWLSLMAARLTRFVLEEEVFKRVNLSPGLPYAVLTMTNYVVIGAGLLIAFGQLGVERTRLTILAGAFSVGLGFGLQNIINNFVSGIILLFERPVKVGDVIQIGDAIGEVRRIGIRASVIGTRDGSDIIVPNGNLISNQFTNWTYSDRQRSVEIPLNIAGGADPNRVLTLLKTAAAGHASTKDHPSPEVYITALTAAGISVTVRAWISHYEDWVQTRSDLSLTLVEALAREDMKLA
jgi:small-conductance mechanosensitive channel